MVLSTCTLDVKAHDTVTHEYTVNQGRTCGIHKRPEGSSDQYREACLRIDSAFIYIGTGLLRGTGTVAMVLWGLCDSFIHCECGSYSKEP
jgi:hypothetical protein